MDLQSNQPNTDQSTNQLMKQPADWSAKHSKYPFNWLNLLFG